MIPPVDTTLDNRLEIRPKQAVFKEIPLDHYDIPMIIGMTGITVYDTRKMGDSTVIEGYIGDVPTSLHLYPTGKA